MLEELGRGVGRLKNQSTMINEETSLHVRLLDEMEGDAERASSGLRAEARHAEKVRQLSSRLERANKQHPEWFCSSYSIALLFSVLRPMLNMIQHEAHCVLCVKSVEQ